MNRDDIEDFIRQMPKIDLHRHLSGAVRSRAMFELAKKRGIEVEGGDFDSFKKLTSLHEDERGFHTFLHKFKSRARFYTDPALIGEVTRAVIRDCAEENIRYLELRFSASHFSRHMGFDMERTTEQIISTAIAESQSAHLDVSFLMTLTRELPLEENEELLRIALSSGLSSYFAGIDIAGDEETVLLEPFKPLIARAVDHGKKVTIHAGEAGPAGNVREAMNAGASRIGHGVACFGHESILQESIERGITFEVCPTSNVHTGTIKEVADLDLKRLLDEGVAVTVNTDDPGISETTLTHELFSVQQVFSLSKQYLKKLLLNAVEGAFISAEQKTKLRRHIDAYFS